MQTYYVTTTSSADTNFSKQYRHLGIKIPPHALLTVSKYCICRQQKCFLSLIKQENAEKCCREMVKCHSNAAKPVYLLSQWSHRLNSFIQIGQLLLPKQQYATPYTFCQTQACIKTEKWIGWLRISASLKGHVL